MIIKFVKKVLTDEDLRINEEKIRTRRPGQRQAVTGIIVNEKMQAPRQTRRKIRQAIYYIEKYGLQSHLEKTENIRANHLKHLLGIANFVLILNPEDKDTIDYYNKLLEMLENNL